MKFIKQFLSIVLVFAVFMTAVYIFRGNVYADSPILPGINAEDAHPNGCVDCHQKVSDTQDYRLNVELANLDGHPNVAPIMKTIPKDCSMCHKQGGAAPQVSVFVHKDHYKNPGENHFVTDYRGACLECHSLNIGTGEMTVKNGPKNW